eukprot:Awhi_evm1s7873
MNSPHTKTYRFQCYYNGTCCPLQYNEAGFNEVLKLVENWTLVEPIPREELIEQLDIIEQQIFDNDDDAKDNYHYFWMNVIRLVIVEKTLKEDDRNGFQIIMTNNKTC